MAEAVNRRSYDSSRRREQARLTRARILDVARASFLAHGYAATTIPKVASGAGVSVETVYAAFRNKPGLLKALFDVAVAGDDAPVPVSERGWVAAIRAEADPRVKIRMYADALSQSMPRAAPYQLLVRAAAAVDTDAAAMWRDMNRERLTGMTALGANLHATGRLRAGITAERARDVVWTYNAVDIYELLVLERGWSIDDYRAFVADALVAALT
jgi:AcrR family transcriptional regulator